MGQKRSTDSTEANSRSRSWNRTRKQRSESLSTDWCDKQPEQQTDCKHTAARTIRVWTGSSLTTMLECLCSDKTWTSAALSHTHRANTPFSVCLKTYSCFHCNKRTFQDVSRTVSMTHPDQSQRIWHTSCDAVTEGRLTTASHDSRQVYDDRDGSIEHWLKRLA